LPGLDLAAEQIERAFEPGDLHEDVVSGRGWPPAAPAWRR